MSEGFYQEEESLSPDLATRVNNIEHALGLLGDAMINESGMVGFIDRSGELSRAIDYIKSNFTLKDEND